jgi:hypothetical protein
MKAFSVKKFETGFKLTEVELRRLVDESKKQLKKINPQESITEYYEVAYQNGAIVEYTNIDNILEQENDGNSKIVRLTITLSKENENNEGEKDIYIKISFTNPSIYEYKNHYSVFLKINGINRDWVFLTSSAIVERYEKIKRRTFGLHSRSIQHIYYILLLIFFITFSILSNFENNDENSFSSILTEIPEYKKINGEYHDSIENYILIKRLSDFEEQKEENTLAQNYLEIEKIRVQSRIFADSICKQKRDSIKNKTKKSNIKNNVEIKAKASVLSKLEYPYGNLIATLFFVIVPYLFWKVLLSLYPLYNFVWGDYVETFAKKKRQLSFLFYAVLIGIIISIIANELTCFI